MMQKSGHVTITNIENLHIEKFTDSKKTKMLFFSIYDTPFYSFFACSQERRHWVKWGGHVHMGCATDFKVGYNYKTGFASGASEKKLYPTFPNVGYKEANISRGLLNILKFAVWLPH